MKKPDKKGPDKGPNMNSGKKDLTHREKSDKSEHSKPESPMERDAGNQDGSAGLGGTSGI